METFLLTLLVMYLSGTLLFSLFYGLFYFIHKATYIRQWLYTWCALFLTYLMMFFSVMLENQMYHYLSGFFVIIAVFFFFKGTLLYRTNRFKDALSVVFIALTALYGLIAFVPFELGLYFAYTTLLSFTFFSLSGVYFCKSQETYERVMGIFVFVLAVLNVLFPFVLEFQTLMLTLVVLLTFVGGVVGFGGLGLHIYKRHLGFVEEKTKLHYLSYHDHLTELFNRNYMDEIIAEIDPSAFSPFSVIVGDLNNLKMMNDTYGHRCGDELIAKAGALLKENLSSRAIIGRYGGDEFLVLLPKTSKYSVNLTLKTLSQRSKVVSVQSVPLSIALGAATYEEGETLSDVILRAEQAMYARKQK